ncbi:uncharacterized protein [Haliotis cracherodii]|uniref:uncharacterized protein n=1 Tax=Haliotis cracherodii TaxID=6455 RepID=UPI0039E86D0E
MMLLVCAVASLMSGASAQFDADVLILGAGYAGLSAASVLAKHNISFIIIEGNWRIGGRAWSVMFGGKMVEVGSMGLHGPEASINNTVSNYNITGKYVDYESVVVKSHQGQALDTQAEAAWTKLQNAQKIVKNLYREIKEGKIADMSMRVALENGQWFPRTPLEDVIEIYDYDFEFSKVPALMSTRGFQSVSDIQDKMFLSTDQRGLQDVMERFASSFMNTSGPQIKLFESVDSINHTDTSVSVSTTGGTTFMGKYAIVTFSMGVLKSNNDMFNPPLPAWKLDTIYKTNMNAYTQIYVKFASTVTNFWGSEQYILHAHPRRGYYPIIINLEAMGFFPTGTNILLFVVTGEEARRVDRERNATVKAEVTAVLKGMYGQETPEPERVFVAGWTGNPYTLGSFTSRQVGDDGNPRFMEALKSRVGRVYFAGEAYDDVMDGFLEGASRSGKHTGVKLWECMMDNKCPQFNPSPPTPPPSPTTCEAPLLSLPLATLLACMMAVFLK